MTIHPLEKYRKIKDGVRFPAIFPTRPPPLVPYHVDVVIGQVERPQHAEVARALRDDVIAGEVKAVDERAAQAVADGTVTSLERRRQVT